MRMSLITSYQSQLVHYICIAVPHGPLSLPNPPPLAWPVAAAMATDTCVCVWCMSLLLVCRWQRHWASEGVGITLGVAGIYCNCACVYACVDVHVLCMRARVHVCVCLRVITNTGLMYSTVLGVWFTANWQLVWILCLKWHQCKLMAVNFLNLFLHWTCTCTGWA